MKKLITILLIFYAPVSIACSCNWLGDFFEATKQTNPDIIVKAKIISKILDNNRFNTKMNVEIINTFKGLDSTKIVTVWGDGGADCRPYVSHFEIGDTYYLALHEYNSDYEIIICGEHFVKIMNEPVVSDLEIRKGLNQIQKMDEDKFVKKLRQETISNFWSKTLIRID